MSPISSPQLDHCRKVRHPGQALAVCLLALVWLGGCASPPEQPAPGEPLPPCGAAPNCVNSMTGEGSQAIEPLVVTPDQWQALREWLGAQEDWQLIQDGDAFVQAVAITPLIRYRDDVQLLYLPQEGLLHVRSSSRLGYGDMGANRDRVEALRSLVATLP